MLRSVTQFLRLLLLTTLLAGCSPPPELTAPQTELVRGCLKLAYTQESSPDCAKQVTKPMEEAFLLKNPDFYDQLLADRKAYVEARLAEELRQRNELNLCLDQREAGNTASTACEKFMKHEIARAGEDRRRRRCAEARLDGKPEAQRHCEGLSARDIEDEVETERRKRSKS